MGKMHILSIMQKMQKLTTSFDILRLIRVGGTNLNVHSISIGISHTDSLHLRQESDRVVTGQNPASSTGTAEKIVQLLKK